MATVFMRYILLPFLLLIVSVAGQATPSVGNETRIISSEEQTGSLSLQNAVIVVDDADHEGVKIAARLLGQDFGRVTGQNASVMLSKSASGSYQNASTTAAIIIGSLDNSTIIQDLVKAGSIDDGPIRGKWESWTSRLVMNPIDGVGSALVIAGSDKRGAMYGAFSVSEQIGVSPWYWWADVTPEPNQSLYAVNVTATNGEPSVKYRGIFINDETPALTDWVHEKFGPVFGPDFYSHVFELLLRLRANFMWPAMWEAYPHPDNSFFVDDPKNQQLANDYGIVIGTSHHEPMQRAMSEWHDEETGPWEWAVNKDNITEYFRYGADRAYGNESYFTMSMRGEGDAPLVSDDPVATLTDVLAVQQKIIESRYGSLTNVPQLIALYKEVQGYYQDGLKVPDHMTLLFADDNFGAIRRLPIGDETNRTGGAGIYFHMEYVGVPRSYKWLNTNSYGRMWHQLQLAHQRGANQIWIFNVADIKPQEVPLSMALRLAWNISSISMDDFPAYFNAFAGQQFGSEHAAEIGQLLLGHTRLIGLRKHEHIEADTFSTLNYTEADSVSNAWNDLLSRAENISAVLPDTKKPAFFELVLHPIKASQIYTDLRISQARNNLYAVQRRNSANAEAKKVLSLFDDDFNNMEDYHTMLGGKWDKIMEQPHYGYTDSWIAPSRDMISGLSFVQNRQRSNTAVGQLGVAVEGNMGIRPGLINEESDRTHPTGRDREAGLFTPNMTTYGPPSTWFELYTRGPDTISWSVQVPSNASWMTANPSQGTLAPTSQDTRVIVSIDWNSVPQGYDNTVLVDVSSQSGDYEQVHIPVIDQRPPGDFQGFVEGSGCVSIEAAHFDRGETQASSRLAKRDTGTSLSSLTTGTTSLTDADPSSNAQSNYWKQYQVLPFVGRSPSGGVSLTLGTDPLPPTDALSYPFYTFTGVDVANVTLYHTLTLDTDPDQPLAYDLAVDDQSSPGVRLLADPPTPGDLPPGWETAVQDTVWTRTHNFTGVAPGAHTLSYRPLTPGLILEKVVVDVGGVRESYLGPPESFFKASA